MESLLTRYKNALTLIAVLLVQIILLATQVRTETGAVEGRSMPLVRWWAVSLISPFEKLFTHSGHGISVQWEKYFWLRHLRQQNEELQAEVNRLRLEQASLAEDARQGQRLQALLSFQETYIYKTVPAQVIGTSASDQSRVLYLDKGYQDGLKPDMPVITPNGVVGKLHEVFRHTSQVLLINDQTSGAGVILEQTRLRGILRGNSIGRTQIVNVLPDSRIKTGEHVLTSGGDQVWPRGLMVGEVESVAADPDHLNYIAIAIKPAVDLARLDEVLVITDSQSQLSPGAQQDIAASQATAAEMRRASDVVAERLPGLKDQNGTAGTSPSQDPNTQTPPPAIAPPPVRPSTPVHTDRYSYGTTPSASDLTPGGKQAQSSTAPPDPSPNPDSTTEKH